MTPEKPYDADQIEKELSSSDPERVLWALKTLDATWNWPERPRIEFPNAACLAVFGTRAPEDAVRAYLGAVDNYLRFDPPPSFEKRWREKTEAVFLHGGGQPVFVLMGPFFDELTPPSAVHEVLDYFTTIDWTNPKWNQPNIFDSIASIVFDTAEVERLHFDVYRAVMDWAIFGTLPDKFMQRIRPALTDREWAEIERVRST